MEASCFFTHDATLFCELCGMKLNSLNSFFVFNESRVLVVTWFLRLPFRMNSRIVTFLVTLNTIYGYLVFIRQIFFISDRSISLLLSDFYIHLRHIGSFNWILESLKKFLILSIVWSLIRLTFLSLLLFLSVSLQAQHFWYRRFVMYCINLSCKKWFF